MGKIVLATIRNEPSGRKSVLVKCCDGKRRTIRLGLVSDKVAAESSDRVQELADRRGDGEGISKRTAAWLGELDDVIRSRLERADLVAPRPGSEPVAKAATVQSWTDSYIKNRKIKKKSTQQVIEKVQRNLVDYFTPDRRLDSITAYDVETWRNWLKAEGNRRDTKKKRTELAESTVRRRTGIAKQIFSAAVRKNLIETNPVTESGLPCTTGTNTARQFRVPREWIYKILDAAPDAEWRAIIALCRFAGLRCPSEVLRLKWEDLNWSEMRMTIHSIKTEHHADGGIRVCPIFPELVPYLRDVQELAPTGSEYVIRRYRRNNSNLRTSFVRIIKRAGLAPWPKLFQNLRASCENDLIDAGHHPKAVSNWIGHSIQVASQSYWQVGEEAFTKAQSVGLGVDEKAAHESGTADDCTGLHSTESGTLETQKTPELIGSGVFAMGDEGLEPPTFSV
ncbi:tyrosine-type recombinase/integrase [Rubripirellula lacrimiformis]|uniref:tyrosine-type recombinase/integrase n=1 Tax=Rubripirellula lacrimiformis TaxID=1930273 RepID=UPI0011A20D43